MTANEPILTDRNRHKREFVMGGFAGFQIELTTTVLKARSISRAPLSVRRELGMRTTYKHLAPNPRDENLEYLRI